MASTKDQTPGRWTKNYNVKEGKIEALVKEPSEMPPRHFEIVTGNLTLLPGELALEMATNPYTLILLLGMLASTKVQMIRHCFTTRDSNRSPIITGVAGDMKTAPLKS
jgi:hypothetical protein